MSSVLPKQKVSKAEKTDDWYKENAKWIRERSNFYSDDRWEMVKLYQAAMGILDPKEYKYVLNPYNTPEQNMRKYPAQIRNYDIITPIVALYVGEKAERPFNHQVISVNSEAPNDFTEGLNQAVEAAMAQQIVNNLNQNGIQTGVDSQQVPEIPQVVEKYKESYRDKRAKFGQEALDYLKYDLNLKDKYQEAIYDWVTVGRTYSYKDVYKNDVIHEIVPPLEIWHGTSQTGFVEDANWAMRKTRYNLSDCIDRFHEQLSKKNEDGQSLIDILETKFRNGNDVVSTTFNQTPNVDKISTSASTSSFLDNDGLIDVFHCVWKSFRKFGILTYKDEFGIEQELEVNEDYKKDTSKGDISLEWFWESEGHETYIIGEDIFLYMRPFQVQRNQLSNHSEIKLPYNGRLGYSERNRLQSVVKQLIPYQVLYNIYHYRSELTLARNKDKLMLMPKGLLPDGWDTDKFLYFAEATGIAFFDETKPNAASVLNAIRGIDMGLGNYVSQMRELLAGIKAEAWDSIGMNRQKFGDIKASDGKGNTDQAVLRSSIITAEMFRRFQRFEESDSQGLLDYSKFAWIKGKKGMYITSNGQKAILDVDSEQHLESDYGVFAVDSAEEAAKLQQAKQYAFGWAQKGATPASTVLEVLASNNMSQLQEFVKKAEQIEKDYQAQIQQSEQQNAQAIEDKLTARQDSINQTDITVAQIQSNTAIQVKNIGAQNELEKIAAKPEEGESEDLGIDKAYNDYLAKVAEGDRKRQELGMKQAADIGKQRLGEQKIAVDREKIKSAEKIAKTNKNKYD